VKEFRITSIEWKNRRRGKERAGRNAKSRKGQERMKLKRRKFY